MSVPGAPSHSSGLRPTESTQPVAVSLVVPTLDRKDDLERLLRSVEVAAANGGGVCEVVIVDNGSSDGTRELAAKWTADDGERYRYVHEPRRGKSIALNTGLRHARGAIVAFTDDDCLLEPGWLVEVVEEFSSDPDLSVLGGRVELFDPDEEPIALATGTERAVLTSPAMLYPTPLIIGGNMAARREVFGGIGGFDEAMGPGTRMIAEDVDFLFRALRQGLRIVYSPSLVVYHNHGRLRTEGAGVDEIGYTYQLGRGAFYLKHAVRGDREIIRMLAADLWEGLNRAVGRGVDEPTTSYLRGLLAGAARRASLEARDVLRQARGEPTRTAAGPDSAR